MWEAVLLSITPSFVQLQIKNKSHLASHLQNFKNNIDQPLSAILTLNTIAHTAGAIGVGVQAAKLWEHTYPLLTTVLVPVLMTLAILILSELIPKTIGANYWQKFVGFTVYSLKLVITLLYPLVWLCQLITKVLKNTEGKSVLSRSEFAAMAEAGLEDGILEKHEIKVIDNLLKFNIIKARDVMTPRTVVKAACQNTTLRDFFEQNKELSFSRIPVFENNLKDQIIGYILKDELLEALVRGEDTKQLKDIKREIQIVKASTPLAELFGLLLENKEHIALVFDDFGGMAGLVTMEDVMETLLGLEIIDESDITEDMQTLARRKWESRAKKLGLKI